MREKVARPAEGVLEDRVPTKDESGLNFPSDVSKQRFCSYWHQVNEIIKLMPEMMIEIGIGNGFVIDYLRKRGMCIFGVDIKKKSGADFLATVTDLPFKNDSFDVIACYQVLEHLPYDSFVRSLKEMQRVTRTRILLSIPDATPVMPVSLILPGLRGAKLLIRAPKLRMKPIPKNHKWELGRPPHNLKSVINDIQSTGLRIIDTYRVFENPYHRFFILSKICE